MAEKAQIDLIINDAGSAKTLGDLENSAERLTEALKGAEIGSAEYNKLNQALIQTNKQVKNLELGFEALDNEQVASEIGSVAGAVGDVTSAMILLGGENESLEQMAANIEQALGVSMAFKGAIEGFSSAMKLFNNVLKANPIFLLAGVIAAVVAGAILLWNNFDKVKEAFQGVGIWVKDLIDSMGAWKNVILALLGPIGWLVMAWDYFFGEQTKKLSEQQKREQELFEQRTKRGKEIAKQHQARLQQIKEESEAEKEAFDDRQEIYDLDIARMEAEGKNSDALKRAKIEDQLEHERFVLESIQKQIDSWTKYYEDLFVLSGKSREDFIAQMKGQGIDLERLQQEALDLVEEQNRKLYQAETELIGFERQLREKNTKEVKEAVEEQKAAYRDLQAERLDFLARLEAAENEFLDSQLSARDREINAVRDKYFVLIEEAIQFGEDTAILEEAQRQRIKEINDRYDQEEKAAREQKEAEKLAAQIETIDKYQQRAEIALKAVEDFNTLFHGKELARAKEKMAAGEKLTKSEIKRLKQEETVRKLQALAQITADTARGVTGAIAAGAGVPFPGNLVAIGTGIAAVLSGAAQAAAVMRESVEIPNVDTTTNAMSETEERSQNTPQTNDFGFGSTFLNQPNKVYVVESDISEVQNKVSVIEAQSSFG